MLILPAHPLRVAAFLAGVLVAGAAVAQQTTPPALVTATGVPQGPLPDAVMSIRAGVQVLPSYLGSSESQAAPDLGLRFDSLRLPYGISLGDADSVGFHRGLVLRGSAQFIPARNADDHSELRGLEDVPLSLEAGLGIGYEQRYYRAFVDLRYGVTGNNAWEGVLGADGILYPVDGLTLTLGPRLSFGSDRFAQTYFGVSDSEAANSSGLKPYNAEGGLLGAGVELGARYFFNDRWGVEGSADWNRLLNGAADSPITGAGSADQYRVRLGLTRRISLDF